MAQASYEEALQIDPTTVEAYHCLAQNNLNQNDSGAAKEILFTGWETTQDEGLLDSCPRLPAIACILQDAERLNKHIPHRSRHNGSIRLLTDPTAPVHTAL